MCIEKLAMALVALVLNAGLAFGQTVEPEVDVVRMVDNLHQVLELSQDARIREELSLVASQLRQLKKLRKESSNQWGELVQRIESLEQANKQQLAGHTPFFGPV